MNLRRFAVPLALLVAAPPVLAAPPDAREPRVAAGSVASPAGSLLARSKLEKGFQFLDPGDTVHTRDTLLALPGVKAALETEPKGVRLTLWGNLRQLSAFPGLQSAAVLHDSRSFDLDFTLLCGRVVVANTKAKGPARVWVRLPTEAWQITLPNPGDEVGLEMFGRWPAGTDFSRVPRPGDEPTRAVTLVVLKGQAELKTEAVQHALTAPPGPAYFFWDSVVGAAGPPRRGEKLPDWADPDTVVPVEGKTVEAVLERFAAVRKGRAPDLALLLLLADADDDRDKARAVLAREVAVFGLAAIDEVKRVADAVADEKHPEVREAAVTALRHWIGDSPGRDPQLYELLMVALRYPAAQAETFMHLLHSPFARDQTETYETLLAYLRHEKAAIRELARWHLLRLVPAGRDIRFDAAAPPDERARGIAAWQKLLVEKMLLPKEK